MGGDDMQAGPFFARDFHSLVEGERFTTPGRTITEADLVSFAALTGDRHPQHCDAEWAERSPFGGRVAHGMLLLSYAVGLMPFDPERVVALRRVSDAVFKSPAYIGDTVHAEGRIDALEPVDDEHGLVGTALRVVKQQGKLAARARMEVLWRAGRGAAGEAPEQAYVKKESSVVVPL
jgi:3-hydroxybutyryl-CoA dehydratase